jgi:hypothetical protein
MHLVSVGEMENAPPSRTFKKQYMCSIIDYRLSSNAAENCGYLARNGRILGVEARLRKDLIQ